MNPTNIQSNHCFLFFIRSYTFLCSTIWLWIVRFADLALLLLPCIERPAFFSSVAPWVALLIEIIALGIIFSSFVLSMHLQDKRQLLREAIYPYIFIIAFTVICSLMNSMDFNENSILVKCYRYDHLLSTLVQWILLRSMVSSITSSSSICFALWSKSKSILIFKGNVDFLLLDSTRRSKYSTNIAQHRKCHVSLLAIGFNVYIVRRWNFEE